MLLDHLRQRVRNQAKFNEQILLHRKHADKSPTDRTNYFYLSSELSPTQRVYKAINFRMVCLQLRLYRFPKKKKTNAKKNRLEENKREKKIILFAPKWRIDDAANANQFIIVSV